MKDLRIIYMGTPAFAVPTLDALVANGFRVVGVVTAPDKPAGRGMKLQASAVKEAAIRHEIPVLQPEKLRDPEFLEALRGMNANLQIVVAFRMLPEAVWAMPEYGTFNVHASLLPDYRGAAPINWAIANGETETGATTFFISHEIDTGDIIQQVREPISPTDTVGELYERLMHKGAQLAIETVRSIANGTCTATPQLLTGSQKLAPKINKDNCRINFSQSSQEIYNLVRGMSPYPAAWTELQGKKLKIFRVRPMPEWPFDPSQEVATDGKSLLAFKTADGGVAVEELQLEGKKRMMTDEFLRGFQGKGISAV